MLYLLVRCFLIVAVHSKAESGLSADCFGAQLDEDLPLRYLHIQVTSSDGTRNVTPTQGGGPRIELTFPASDHTCRHRYELIDRGDGAFVFRLRLLEACAAVEISVRLLGRLVCGSPIRVVPKDRPYLEPAGCHCPRGNVEDLLQRLQCPRGEPQIERDLERWPKISFSAALNRALDSWAHDRNRFSISICHYIILNNRIYRRCYGAYVGFADFLDTFLVSLSSLTRLPDTQFLFNLGDYPLEHNLTHPVPVLSWCGSEKSADPVLPTYEFTSSALAAGSPIDVHTAMGMKPIPWDRKERRAIFRGRDSHQLRLDVARKSLEYPDLLDAGVTRYFFHNSSEQPPTKETIDFHHFFRYRYVVSIDGTVAAYRLPFLLAGNSVILKAESQFYEHFYSRLQPWKHYIPFTDADDLVRKIEWAETQQLQAVTQAARQFANDHLQPHHVYCYYARFLQEYSKRLVDPPTFIPVDMQLVERKLPNRQRCLCERAAQDERNEL